MANTRIKDLSNTATNVASDAFIAIDGSANGTEKISRDNLRQDTADALAAAPSTYNLAPLTSGSVDVDKGGTGSTTVAGAKTNLEIPKLGTAANEVPVNGMLNSGAWLDFDAFYEEGTWVPEVAFGGSSAGILYSAQVGNFTRAGNLVNVTGLVTLSNVGTANGTATVSSLPFTSMSLTNDYQSIAVGYADGFSGLSGPITGLVKNGNTYIALYDWGATGVSSVLETNFGNNSTIRFSATYQIA